MIDNINKLSSNLDTNKQPQQQQQTAASVVNLSDDGEIFVIKTSFFNLDKEQKATPPYFLSQ